MKIAYTSDLHIEFLVNNLQKKHKREFSVQESAEMFCVALSKIECDFAVVAGDTSHCVADIILFFSEIDKQVSKPIYVILGNHDYWNWQSSLVRRKYEERPYEIESIEEQCKTEFAKFKNIKLLVAGDKHTQNGLTIIGDCGFAAFNNSFNCRNGIYRSTLKDWYKEKALTERWVKFYKSAAFTGDKTLIITHNPPTDWGYNYEPKDDNRYYIFGHVHDVDARTCTGAEIITKDNYYGDAANGYRKSDIEFKVLEINDTQRDLFICKTP